MSDTIGTSLPQHQNRRLRRTLDVAIPITGVLAPAAWYLLLRIPLGNSAFNPLGLPWPAWRAAVVLALSVIVIAIGIYFFGVGLRTGGRWRVASFVVLGFWVLAIIPGFIFFFLTIYGDVGA